MNNSLNIKTISKIPYDEAKEYKENRVNLIEYVNFHILNHKDTNKLIGSNPWKLIVDNHKNHFEFMSSLFLLNDFEILSKTLPWVYRVYSNRGVEYQYFLVELNFWIEDIKKYLIKSGSIIKVYEWIIENHEKIIKLSQIDEKIEIKKSFKELQREFLNELLNANHSRCYQISKERVSNWSEFKDFFLNVIQPSMYEIGYLWEENKISVAKEHIATSIVMKIISFFYLYLDMQKSSKSKIIVATVTNELHESGALILANSLEADGFDVSYLGANVPIFDIIDEIKKSKPKIVALSVTMTINLEILKELTKKIRELNMNIKIIVGGLAFNKLTFVDNEKFGVDAYLKNCDEAIEKTNEWSIND